MAEKLRDHQAKVGNGSTMRQTADDTAQATARAVGYSAGLGFALSFEPEVMEAAR